MPFVIPQWVEYCTGATGRPSFLFHDIRFAGRRPRGFVNALFAPGLQAVACRYFMGSKPS